MLSVSFIAVLTSCIEALVVENANLIEGGNEFGYNLARNLHNHDKSSNIWISPFCISSCFALVYPGSNGETRSQIANVMGYPTDNTFAVTKQFIQLQSSIENTYNGTSDDSFWARKISIIGIANKIYVSNTLSLKQSYVNALNDGHHSFIQQGFDFTSNNAAQIINQWVDKSTNGLIDSIIDKKTKISGWKLAALNAIYLNGTFRSQFKKYMTSSNPFYSDASRTKKISNCHLMHQYENFDYYSNGEHQFLKFPFSDSADLFVLFALPTSGNRITDKSVIDVALKKLESTYIALALPKLSIEASYDLNEPLKHLGMTDAFLPSADFSGMSEDTLEIDKVIHKTMIKMDENGLVAAAASIIAMKIGGAFKKQPTPILFKADHSFTMFIIDGQHDNAILFMGNVNNPGIPQGSDIPTFDESTDPIWNNFTATFDEPVVDNMSQEKHKPFCRHLAVKRIFNSYRSSCSDFCCRNDGRLVHCCYLN